MPHAMTPHVAFFYTGIPSYAAALRLGEMYLDKIEYRCTSQSAVLRHFADLHDRWDKSGRKGLETVTVLGALIPKDLLEHRQSHPCELEEKFTAMKNAGVKIFLLNEYAVFDAPEWAGAVQRGSLNNSGSSLVEAVEELHCLQNVPDPFALAKLIKSKDRESDVYKAMLWLDVEIKQFDGKSSLLNSFTQDLLKGGVLTEEWKKRAKQQADRGQAILVGDNYKPVLEMVKKVAKSTLPVLILGPSGSGKEALAKRIHYMSPRCDKNLLMESCANFPDTLIEAELFGTRKGSFTGSADKEGLLQLADGGTLFLDELGELSKPAQGKLLRFLQEGTFRPVGGTEEIKVDVRLVAATNEKLYDRVKAGTFRADLWYRITGAILETPRLTGTPGWESSIKAIASHMTVELYQQDEMLREELKEAKHPKYLAEKETAALLEYDWPGNVRELRQAIHLHLVTKTPMAEIVANLRKREEDWKQAHAQDAQDLFIVRGTRNADEVLDEYCDWVQKHNPGLTQKQLGDLIGLSDGTVRKRLRSVSERSRA